jgi:aldose 1-epimerase
VSTVAPQRLVSGDLAVEILPLGATLHRFQLRQPGGGWRDLVLCRDDPGLLDTHYFGATVGRFANRIDKARFTLDGHEYLLAANDGGNQLHGGPEGFSELIWDVVAATPDSITLTLTSPDGDQGYPGTLHASAEYSLRPDGLQVVYTATTDAPTPVNLTTHPYFNLDGSASIDDHVLTLPGSSTWTVNRDDGIPTGEVRPVAGTGADYRAGRRYVEGHDQAVAEGITRRGGFDHNFPVAGTGLREHARLSSPDGLTLVVRSDAPAIQVYGGDHMGRRGIALEAQNYPDAPNQPGFPDSVLRPGDTDRATTQWLISRPANPIG